MGRARPDHFPFQSPSNSSLRECTVKRSRLHTPAQTHPPPAADAERGQPSVHDSHMHDEMHKHSHTHAQRTHTHADDDQMHIRSHTHGQRTHTHTRMLNTHTRSQTHVSVCVCVHIINTHAPMLKRTHTHTHAQTHTHTQHSIPFPSL